MSVFVIKRGLNIPLAGAPVSMIENGCQSLKTVGVAAGDYKGLKPRLLVTEGAAVELGAPLFEDKSTGALFTAPAAGTIKAIHRGAKRRLLTVELNIAATDTSAARFSPVTADDLGRLERKEICHTLNQAGCWVTLRERPYGRIPAFDSIPHAIFVTAMDTEPLGNYPALIISLNANAFAHGLLVLAQLTAGFVHVCKHPKPMHGSIPHPQHERIQHHTFAGSHPAGLPGTHIHLIAPIGLAKKKVWYIGYQDVIRIGKLFLTGELFMERYVALGGPQVLHPRILKTRLGANVFELSVAELKDGETRLISGSPLAGRCCEPATSCLGPFANALAAVAEDRGRYFQDFMVPGLNKFSLKAVFLSSFIRNKQFAMGSSTHGSRRAVVPIGAYEEVMPLKILATPLIKALLANDSEAAEQLGALELEGEDLALCTFVCPCKNNISAALDAMLEQLYYENA